MSKTRQHTHLDTLTEFSRKIFSAENRDEDVFRLRFNSISPVREIVLSERGLYGHVLIRGEDFAGRTQALVHLCNQVTRSGFGVIYVSDGLGPSVAASLKQHTQDALGPGHFFSLNVDAERGVKFKVSRHGVGVLQFSSGASPSDPKRVRRRVDDIIEWIIRSDPVAPLLLVLENYHYYSSSNLERILIDGHAQNCAVVLTTLASNPRVDIPPISQSVYDKCGLVVDLNRRRASTDD